MVLIRLDCYDFDVLGLESSDRVWPLVFREKGGEQLDYFLRPEAKSFGSPTPVRLDFLTSSLQDYV